MFRRPLIILGLSTLMLAPPALARDQWTTEQAQAWHQKKGWLVGCNYIPSSAINELEMWQSETFDLETIDRELGWAEDLGFTSIRVFLHDRLWEQDSEGFLKRIDQFLDVAHKHHIGVMLVIFDSVWDPDPKLGPQREPKPGVHNSGWVQSPGAEYLDDPSKLDSLKPYVVGVIGHFKDDARIDCWDLYNEPDNLNPNNPYGKLEPPKKVQNARLLLKKTFQWARSADPSQPLTSGVWIGDWSEQKLTPMRKLQLEQSDVISFHSYDPLPRVKARIKPLRRYHRPLLCTEYMARPQGSTFDPVLGYFEKEGIGAYNWGFVDGKSQTIYPWDSWRKPYTSEPPVWFHDIFHRDGTPYRPEEVTYIKKITGRAKRQD